MTDQPENLILRHLQDIRADIASMRDQIGVLTQGQLGLRTEMHDIRTNINDMRTDIKDLAGRFRA